MSDYAISVKLRNGRIRRKIAECGFSSVNELCRKSGLRPEYVGALINLKLPPLTRAGRWRRSAAALAEALGCTCEELFSETQRTLALRDNHGECFITETGLLKLSSRVEQPLLDNPGEQLLEDADEQKKIEVIRQALDGLHLAARDQQIVESHFGIGCEERTLADLASEHAVSYDFVRNRLSKVFLRLRDHNSATRRSLLQAYKPADAMGTAEEARKRMARRRAAVPAAEMHADARTGERRVPPSQRMMKPHAEPQSGNSTRPRL